MFNIPDYIYSTVFYWTMYIICLVFSLYYVSSSDNHLLLKQNSRIPAILFSIALILFIGYRPISGRFQDMMAYAHQFERIVTPNFADIHWDGEWGLELLMNVCKENAWSATTFFLIVAFIYVALQTYACKKLIWENTLLGVLFCISAFSFWGFATNGIRNGMACSIALVGICQIIKKENLPALLACLFAIGVHRSTILPIMMAILAVYVIKSPKIAIYFWLLSIILSLLFGDAIVRLFILLGFDDRMTLYLTLSSANQGFTYTGFRWDFLLYSSIPIFLTWYVTQSRGIQDTVFNQLATTYILSNAFWVMVIRAAFSNRFAYLSWFIYPILLAYLFIRIPLWENQDKKAGFALLLHASFTIGMFLIGKLY